MMATCPSSKMVLKSVSMITLGAPAIAVTVTISDIMPLRAIREIGILIILRWVFDGGFVVSRTREYALKTRPPGGSSRSTFQGKSRVKILGLRGKVILYV